MKQGVLQIPLNRLKPPDEAGFDFGNFLDSDPHPLQAEIKQYRRYLLPQQYAAEYFRLHLFH